MKKLFNVLLIAVMSALVLTGCTSTSKNFFGLVKGVVIGDDYEAAGRMVGEAGYMAYIVMKGDPKYDKYTAKMEEVYAALDAAGDFDTGSLNQTILEVARVALTAKYGYVYGTLITDGIRVGGVIADRLILKNVSATDATLYAKGLKEGIDEARSKTPLSALDEAEKARQEKIAKEKAKKEAEAAGKEYIEEDEWAKAKYITCKPVNTCVYKFKDRTLATQKRIAQELDKFGFLDEKEEPADEYSVTKHHNVMALITRCEDLEKYGIKKLNVWISEVKVDCKWKVGEDGKEELDEKGNKIADCKLVAIRFLYEEKDGSIKEADCVGCVVYTELDNIPDEILFGK